jgi:hypothetical protein
MCRKSQSEQTKLFVLAGNLTTSLNCINSAPSLALILFNSHIIVRVPSLSFIFHHTIGCMHLDLDENKLPKAPQSASASVLLFSPESVAILRGGDFWRIGRYLARVSHPCRARLSPHQTNKERVSVQQPV